MDIKIIHVVPSKVKFLKNLSYLDVVKTKPTAFGQLYYKFNKINELIYMNVIPETQNILFLDIETVPQYPNRSIAPERYQTLWEKKAKSLNPSDFDRDEFYQRAGIYSEFGKIICISTGYFYKKDLSEFRVKSFYGKDEKELLVLFADTLTEFCKKRDTSLCGHNGKEFDFPYIARRMIINDILLPDILQVSGKKPWETPYIDTIELWKFGDKKNYTSLDTLAFCFDIPSPKSDIDGSMVYKVFYEDDDLERIVKYCKNDVLTLARVYLKLKQISLPTNFKVKISD